MNSLKNPLAASLLTLALSICFTSSCSKSNLENTKILRFEKELFSLAEDSRPDIIGDLKITYPDFLSVFCTEIINIGPDTADMTGYYLRDFCLDPVIREVSGKIDSVYPDFDKTGKSILSSISRYESLSGRNDSITILTYMS